MSTFSIRFSVMSITSKNEIFFFNVVCNMNLATIRTTVIDVASIINITLQRLKKKRIFNLFNSFSSTLKYYIVFEKSLIERTE